MPLLTWVAKALVLLCTVLTSQCKSSASGRASGAFTPKMMVDLAKQRSPVSLSLVDTASILCFWSHLPICYCMGFVAVQPEPAS